MTEDEILEIVAEQERKGVSIEFHDWREPGSGVKALYWRPGDPNALAESIIRHVVNGEVTLELDGHEYVIRKKKTG